MPSNLTESNRFSDQNYVQITRSEKSQFQNVNLTKILHFFPFFMYRHTYRPRIVYQCRDSSIVYVYGNQRDDHAHARLARGKCKSFRCANAQCVAQATFFTCANITRESDFCASLMIWVGSCTISSKCVESRAVLEFSDRNVGGSSGIASMRKILIDLCFVVRVDLGLWRSRMKEL